MSVLLQISAFFADISVDMLPFFADISVDMLRRGAAAPSCSTGHYLGAPTAPAFFGPPPVWRVCTQQGHS
jgi:hypothetical protein